LSQIWSQNDRNLAVPEYDNNRKKQCYEKKIIVFIEKIHLLLFGHPISSEMKAFLGNLSWSFLGGGFASFILMVVAILGSRYMGPESYGKYILILTYSQFLVIAIFLGLDTASARAIASSKTHSDKAKNISSFLAFVVLNTVFISALVFSFRKILFDRFSLDPTLFWLLMLFTIFFIFKTMLDFSVKGMMLFKVQFVGWLLETAGVTSSFILFFFVLKQQTYNNYTYAIVIGSVLMSVYYLRTLLPFLGQFDWKYLKDQTNYAKLFLINIQNKIKDIKIIYRPHPWRQTRKCFDYFIPEDFTNVIMDKQLINYYLANKLLGNINAFQPELEYYPKLLKNCLFVISPLTTMIIDQLLSIKKF
jgi:hypothetical protein